MADLLNPVHAKRYGRGIQRILPPVGAAPLPRDIPHTSAPQNNHCDCIPGITLPLGEGRGEGYRLDLRCAKYQAKLASSPLNTSDRRYQK